MYVHYDKTKIQQALVIRKFNTQIFSKLKRQLELKKIKNKCLGSNLGSCNHRQFIQRT